MNCQREELPHWHPCLLWVLQAFWAEGPWSAPPFKVSSHKMQHLLPLSVYGQECPVWANMCVLCSMNGYNEPGGTEPWNETHRAGRHRIPSPSWWTMSLSPAWLWWAPQFLGAGAWRPCQDLIVVVNGQADLYWITPKCSFWKIDPTRCQRA